MDKAQLEARIKELSEHKEKLVLQTYVVDGALQECQNWLGKLV